MRKYIDTVPSEKFYDNLCRNDIIEVVSTSMPYIGQTFRSRNNNVVTNVREVHIKKKGDLTQKDAIRSGYKSVNDMNMVLQLQDDDIVYCIFCDVSRIPQNMNEFLHNLSQKNKLQNFFHEEYDILFDIVTCTDDEIILSTDKMTEEYQKILKDFGNITVVKFDGYFLFNIHIDKLKNKPFIRQKYSKWLNE